MTKQKRFGVALVAYILLGLLIWATMSDVPIKVMGGQVSIRALTLAIVAFFAVRTFLHLRLEQPKAEDDESLS